MFLPKALLVCWLCFSHRRSPSCLSECLHVHSGVSVMDSGSWRSREAGGRGEGEGVVCVSQPQLRTEILETRSGTVLWPLSHPVHQALQVNTYKVIKATLGLNDIVFTSKQKNDRRVLFQVDYVTLHRSQRCFLVLAGKGQLPGKYLEAVIKLPDTSKILVQIYCDLATSLSVGQCSSHLNFENQSKNPEGIIKILWAAKQMFQVL